MLFMEHDSITSECKLYTPFLLSAATATNDKYYTDIAINYTTIIN